ncbi:hypothetical protein JCM10212_004627 [Sporobolomyces blumeae]
MEPAWERVPAPDGQSSSTHYRFSQATTPLGERSEGETIVPLLRLVQVLVGSRSGGATVSTHSLRLNLGRFRGVRLVVEEYNDEPASPVTRYRLANLFAALGVALTSSNAAKVAIPGLDTLIEDLDPRDEATSERHDLTSPFIHFDDLDVRFQPGTLVSYPTSVGHAAERIATRVRSCHYEERRTALGNVERQFNLELETVVPVASRLALVSFTEVLSGWSGDRRKRVADLAMRPILAGQHSTTSPESELAAFTARGRLCLSMLPRARDQERYRFLAYTAGGFFPHADRTSTSAASIVGSGGGSGGRIVVDGDLALALGHHPSRGSTEADLALVNAAGRYKRAGRRAEGLLVLDANPSSDPDDRGSFPPSLVPLIWPALCGFSLTQKRWGHVLVTALDEIAFNRRAFDQLVLSPDRKRLIHAVVNSHRLALDRDAEGQGPGRARRTKMRDIISSKSGGTVFLLHGAPGVGKTLTAEAVAEMLGRPVYYVTMGELGTSVELVEARLAAVLDLCAAWRAVVLIDEADVFLERRSSAQGGGGGGDVLRNALVCVLLRLIEYFEGILFLTTNRISSFDPAVESRVTIALRYDELDVKARESVWRNLVENLEVPSAKDSDETTPDARTPDESGSLERVDLDYERLAQHDLNGRQIKNTLRLALALAADSDEPLSQDLLDLTIETTLVGRREMRDGHYSL